MKMTLKPVMAFLDIVIFIKNDLKSKYGHSMKKERETMLGTDKVIKNFTVLDG